MKAKGTKSLAALARVRDLEEKRTLKRFRRLQAVVSGLEKELAELRRRKARILAAPVESLDVRRLLEALSEAVQQKSKALSERREEAGRTLERFAVAARRRHVVERLCQRRQIDEETTSNRREEHFLGDLAGARRTRERSRIDG